MGLIMPLFAPEDPTAWNTYFRNMPPSGEHYMGTNNLGQDIFWLLTWSIRNSLWIGLSVAALATLIGVTVGLLSGFVGGFDKAVAVGLLPFIAGDIVKAIIAAIAFPAVWKLLGDAR